MQLRQSAVFKCKIHRVVVILRHTRGEREVKNLEMWRQKQLKEGRWKHRGDAGRQEAST